MKNKYKITIIIISQITLIIGSFLALAILESQTTFLGNSVNVAGKNRFLSSQFLDEVKNWSYVKNPAADPDKAFQELEQNIFLLKNGGVSGNISIKKLANEFDDDWINVSEHLTNLKTKFIEFKSKRSNILTYSDIIDLEIATLLLVQSSDSLVEKLSSSMEAKSQSLVYLNIFLLITNVAVHIFLILVILSMYRTEFSRNVKIQKLATIGELSSRLAHDMRTPLSNINMSMQLLKKGITEKPGLEKIHSIEQAVDRISHQVNDVMDFVKTREPNLMIWKLNLILKGSLDKIQIPKRIEISLPEKDFAIKCDRDQMEILFINLISNAIDSIDQKGQIKIYAKKLPGKIMITVEDSGKGIPSEYVDQIFDPLFTLKERGTGLGLSSCKNIVESHRGTISVSIHPTKFTIILPQNQK